MGGVPIEPLTPDEAKMQLRMAASRVSPTLWIRSHPVGAVAVGVVTGFLLGRAPKARNEITRRVFDRLI